MEHSDTAAFPSVFDTTDKKRVIERFVQFGLTKRELFAAISMHGLRAGEENLGKSRMASADVAGIACSDAGALMVELNRTAQAS